jgi:uncharacterized membrane protein YgcG
MKQKMPKLTRSPRWWPLAVAALAIVLISFSGSSFAAKGGIKGKPTGGEAGNNLSTPSVQSESPVSVPARWFVPEEPELGVHYSYGCDAPESDGTFKYPNTSCVDNLGNPSSYYTAEQCIDEVQPSPCQGLAVSRIYWQKVEVNDWWADDDGRNSAPVEVAYVDWGDALEAVSWNERSVIRVETQPYSSTIEDYLPWETSCEAAALAKEPALDPNVVCRVGFQMWHVSGQGITEHWGVRASDEGELDEVVGELPAGTSYNYDSPFQIIKTIDARLNLTKMAPDDAICSQPGEGGEGDLPPVVGPWDPVNAEWANTCTYSDEPYSVETSVGGKYVYGFNWRMKNVELDSICSGWEKTGFWRLTFHTDPSDKVMFSAADALNVAPPAVPSAVRVLPRDGQFNDILADPPAVPEIVVESEDPTADDRLYRPVIDVDNNLTYLDICIVGKTQGGGGGGGGKPGGGGGKPGGGGGGGGGKP